MDSRLRGSKTVNVTHAYENFHCQDVSVAIPWSGSDDLWCIYDVQDQHEESALIDKAHDSPTIANRTNVNDPSTSSDGSTGKIFGMTCYSLHDERRTSTSTVPCQTPCPRTNLSSYGMLSNKSAWGMVIVTGGLRGELKTFQNFGLPSVRN